MKSGIDNAPVDSQIRPQDDLFRHVNGTWLKEVDIPDDRATYGAFVVLVEEAEKAVREIIEAAAESVDPNAEIHSAEGQSNHADTVRQKIGLLYQNFMDEDAVDAMGVTPIANDISQIESIASIEEFITRLGQLERDGVASALAYGVTTDPAAPDEYVLRLVQSGL